MKFAEKSFWLHVDIQKAGPKMSLAPSENIEGQQLLKI